MENVTQDEETISLRRFIVLDIETTGVNCKRDKIIEIAAVKYEEFREVDYFSTLVNPQIPLPDIITRLTGITSNDLNDAPIWEDIQSDFLAFIEDLPIVGHNICGFDLRFIECAIGAPLNAPLIDTLDLSRFVFYQLSNHKLSHLKDVLGININASHRALADVRTTFHVFEACLYHLSHPDEPPVKESGAACQESINKRNATGQQRHWRKIDIKAICPTCKSIDSCSPLFGKNIVFTGTLSIPREEAMQIAVNAGATLKTSVSSKTDYLVVGRQDIALVGADGMSGKEERAYELNNAGKASIQIISEAEFLSLATKEGVAV